MKVYASVDNADNEIPKKVLKSIESSNISGIKSKATLASYISKMRIKLLWLFNGFGIFTIAFSICISILIINNQTSQANMIFNYLKSIKDTYSMYLGSMHASFHNTEIYAFITDLMTFPYHNMQQIKFFDYEQNQSEFYGEQFYQAYRNLQLVIMPLKNSVSYYQILFNITLRIKNLILEDRFFINDTINNVLSNIVTNINLIGEMDLADLKGNVQYVNYLKYNNWNIQNALNYQMSNVLNLMLNEILDMCDLSKSTQMLLFYMLAIIGLFFLFSALCMFEILLYNKKNKIYNLILNVNPKLFIKLKEECNKVKETILVYD